MAKSGPGIVDSKTAKDKKSETPLAASDCIPLLKVIKGMGVAPTATKLEVEAKLNAVFTKNLKVEDVVDEAGRSALDYAAEYANPHAMRWLIDKFSFISKTKIINKIDTNALRPSTVLLRHIYSDAIDAKKATPKMRHEIECRNSILRILIENGADFWGLFLWENSFYNSPIYEAARKGNRALLEIFFQELRANKAKLNKDFSFEELIAQATHGDQLDYVLKRVKQFTTLWQKSRSATFDAKQIISYDIAKVIDAPIRNKNTRALQMLLIYEMPTVLPFEADKIGQMDCSLISYVFTVNKNLSGNINDAKEINTILRKRGVQATINDLAYAVSHDWLDVVKIIVEDYSVLPTGGYTFISKYDRSGPTKRESLLELAIKIKSISMFAYFKEQVIRQKGALPYDKMRDFVVSNIGYGGKLNIELVHYILNELFQVCLTLQGLSAILTFCLEKRVHNSEPANYDYLLALKLVVNMDHVNALNALKKLNKNYIEDLQAVLLRFDDKGPGDFLTKLLATLPQFSLDQKSARPPAVNPNARPQSVVHGSSAAIMLPSSSATTEAVAQATDQPSLVLPNTPAPSAPSAPSQSIAGIVPLRDKGLAGMVVSPDTKEKNSSVERAAAIDNKQDVKLATPPNRLLIETIKSMGVAPKDGKEQMYAKLNAIFKLYPHVDGIVEEVVEKKRERKYPLDYATEYANLYAVQWLIEKLGGDTRYCLNTINHGEKSTIIRGISYSDKIDADTATPEKRREIECRASIAQILLDNGADIFGPHNSFGSMYAPDGQYTDLDLVASAAARSGNNNFLEIFFNRFKNAGEWYKKFFNYQRLITSACSSDQLGYVLKHISELQAVKPVSYVVSLVKGNSLDNIKLLLLYNMMATRFEEGIQGDNLDQAQAMSSCRKYVCSSLAGSIFLDNDKKKSTEEVKDMLQRYGIVPLVEDLAAAVSAGRLDVVKMLVEEYKVSLSLNCSYTSVDRFGFHGESHYKLVAPILKIAYGAQSQAIFIYLKNKIAELSGSQPYKMMQECLLYNKDNKKIAITPLAHYIIKELLQAGIISIQEVEEKFFLVKQTSDYINTIKKILKKDEVEAPFYYKNLRAEDIEHLKMYLQKFAAPQELKYFEQLQLAIPRHFIDEKSAQAPAVNPMSNMSLTSEGSSGSTLVSSSSVTPGLINSPPPGLAPSAPPNSNPPDYEVSGGALPPPYSSVTELPQQIDVASAVIPSVSSSVAVSGSQQVSTIVAPPLVAPIIQADTVNKFSQPVLSVLIGHLKNILESMNLANEDQNLCDDLIPIIARRLLVLSVNLSSLAPLVGDTKDSLSSESVASAVSTRVKDSPSSVATFSVFSPVLTLPMSIAVVPSVSVEAVLQLKLIASIKHVEGIIKLLLIAEKDSFLHDDYLVLAGRKLNTLGLSFSSGQVEGNRKTNFTPPAATI